ncbi:RP-L24, MRPL24, rplX [Ceraceosorus bombacis]|uniref:RP-L24, MRPL24, rplX n=1 Tax=Ceraceosorus bombacis TaxID=401625 RepID=A0A0P1BBQ4_9BASI|nr:RP-L24, MRPL24, rplX [Ceraceosorus bombacis]
MAVPRLTAKELDQRFKRGTKTAIVALRNLDHMLPGQKGWKGKFADKMLPARARRNNNYVQPKDRIRLWNIVPGDVVRYRTGVKLAKEGSAELWKGQATVKQIDRTRNLAWLANVDNPGDNPATSEKRIVPRQMGEDGQVAWSNNTFQINRPVHISNLQLLLPQEMVLPAGCGITMDELKEGRVATRVQGTGAKWNKQLHQYTWKRFAIVKAKDGTNVKLEVPWPPNKTAPRIILQDLTTPNDAVKSESWIPWYPTNPIHISRHTWRTSPQSEAMLRAQKAIREAQPRILRKPGYAPYLPVRQGPPPVAQAPTPAEAVTLRKAAQRKWAMEHPDMSEGRSFASSDYHNVAPLDGPVANGPQWRWIPPKTPFQAGDRNEDGIRLGIAGKDEIDAWPIELLMERELSPPRSLAKRMKQFQISKLTKQAELKKQQEIMDKNLEALRNIEL